MARKPILQISPNFAGITQFVAVSATSEATGFEASRLQDERPSEAWRSTSPAPHKCILRSYVRPSVSAFFRPESDCFGALPTNLWRESGQFRVIGYSSISARAPEEILPNGTGALHSVTSGAVGDIDEGWSGAADGSFIQFNAGDDLHLQFASPSADPREGAGLQSFVIEIEGTSDAGETAQGCEAWLYESDVLRKHLGYKFLPGEITGQGSITLIFPWDAVDLINETGAVVELRFRFFSGCNVKVHRVAWVCETDATFATDKLFDTEWQTAWPSVGGSFAAAVRPEEESFPPYALHQAAAGTTYSTLQDVHILLRDDQVPIVQVDGGGYITTAHVPRIPDGYVEAGVFMWTLGTELPRGCKYGPAARINDDSPTARTAGQQLLGSSLPKFRTVYADLNPLSSDLMAALVDRIDLLKGKTRPLLFQPNPDNATESQLFNVYGYLRDTSDFVRERTSTPLYGKAYVFEEAR